MDSLMTPAHSQRLKFLRSIRKLGDLITDSSTLLEGPLSPTSPILGPAQGSSRAFLSLRLSSKERALRLSPSAEYPAISISPSFNVSLPPSPSDWESDTDAVACDPIQKLAKVQRTLGSNVPPSLVLDSVLGSGGKRSRNRSRNRSSTVSAASECTAASGVVARRRRQPHARTGSRAALRHASSSSSVHSAAVPGDVGQESEEPFSFERLMPVPSGTGSTQAVGSDDRDSDDMRSGMYRKEVGWSGEWSGDVRCLEDVVKGLRELRSS